MCNLQKNQVSFLLNPLGLTQATGLSQISSCLNGGIHSFLDESIFLRKAYFINTGRNVS